MSYKLNNITEAEFFYYNNYLSQAKSNELLKIFINNTPWQQEKVLMFGKLNFAPRKYCLYGKHDYFYGGYLHTALPFTPELQYILDDVNTQFSNEFNSILLNYYGDGNNHIGFHADDEKSLGNNPTIASISLGAERNFLIKHRYSVKTLPLLLQHGSLLLMGDKSQKNYLHALPKSGSLMPRVNLTLRKLCQN